MANNTKRFLSLLLALVMVIGLMPVGHAHAEENETINLNIGDTHTIAVDGDQSSVVGDDIISVDTAFVQDYTDVTVVKSVEETPAAEIESGAQYVIMSKTGKATHPSKYVKANALTSNGGAKGLELVNDISNATSWTITAVDDGYTISDGATNIQITGRNTVGLAENAVVSIEASTLGDSKWVIFSGSDCCLNHFDSFAGQGSSGHAASAWEGKSDTGAQWQLFKVTSTEVATISYYTRSDEAFTSGIVDTGIYYIAAGSSNKVVSNATVNAGAYGGGGHDGRAIVPCDDVTSGDVVWTIEETAGGYYVKDNNGKYLSMPGNGYAVLVDEPVAMTLQNNGATWAIGENVDGTVYYLNDFGASQGAAAAWAGSATDGGNQWTLYPAAACGETTVTFTAEAGGDTTFVIGETTYSFHVHAPADPEPEASFNCTENIVCAGCGETLEAGAAEHVRPEEIDDCTNAVTCVNCDFILEDAHDEHVFDNDCTTADKCANCSVEAAAAEEHAYDDEYDADCNVCGTTREVPEKPVETEPVETEPEFEPEYTSEQITGITGEASSNDAGDGSNIEEAFDGIKNDAGNYWASVANAAGIEGNEYLIANLGGKYLVNQVAYTSRSVADATGNLNDYVIWVSTDGETYEQVTSGAIETLPGTTTITFDAVEATHVKLTATSSYHWKPTNANTVMAVGEFEVFKAVCVAHTFDADCSTDDTCKYCDAVAAAADHVFDNDCTTDDKCANCEVKAEAAEAHVFDKDCSTADKCANCEQTAEAVPHVFDKDCASADKCANCDVVAEAGEHTFDGDCTTADKCENCDEVATKADAHVFDDDCTTDDKCANCLVLAEKAEAHVFDKDCMTADKCANCEQTATAAAEHALDEGVHTDGENGGLGYTTYSCTNEGCEYTTDVDDEYTFSNEQITGITGEASSVDTNEPAFDKSVGNAFDGDPNTFWATTESGLADAYLIADLGGEKLINKIEYTKRYDAGAKYGCTGNLLNYIIEVSTDGETWTQVAEGETVDGTTEIVLDEPVKASKVRLTSTSTYGWNAATSNQVMTCAEFAVYEAICDYHIPAEDDNDCTTALNCTVCGEELVPAAEHTPDEDDHDCTTALNCSVCGTEITAATEHAMDDGVYTEGEGEELGYTTYSCTNEGCEHTDVVYDEPDPTPDETDPEPTVPVEIDFNATKVNWTGEAESQTVFSNTEGLFTYAWDGQTNTIWHTDWQSANKGILTGENTISAEINFGEAYTINQFSFLPRQDGAAQSWPDGCCLLLQGSLFVKAAEDAEWVCVADQVTFAHTEALKTFYFTEQPVQFVKLVCERASQMGLSDGNGPLGYVAVAEFYIEDDAASDLTITATNDGYGTISGVPEAPVAIGTSVTLTAVPAEGRTFEGWYNSMNTKVSTDAEYTFPAATNITLTAKFVDNTYTVTFDHGYNEQTSTKTVTHGNTVALPTVTREGYTFDGWFDAEGNEFTADTAVTGDITVTAKWTEAVVEPTIPEVTDPSEPDASEPDASEPEASEPDASEPDASEPDASEPDASEPDASEPDASEPDASEPEASEPDASEPEYTVPECDKDENCTLSQFDDIVVTEWYHDGIHFCVEEGIMNGMGEGKFAPNENTTRAQLVMMLYRLAGTPGIEGKTEPFTDVAENDWFYAPIVWAYENKVVNGVSETEFAPNAGVTREQVATILYRYLGEPEGTGKLDAFPDVADVSEYAVAPLTWAVGEGLITGIAQADGTALLAPTGNATRAQIATILMRHLTK